MPRLQRLKRAAGPDLNVSAENLVLQGEVRQTGEAFTIPALWIKCHKTWPDHIWPSIGAVVACGSLFEARPILFERVGK